MSSGTTPNSNFTAVVLRRHKDTDAACPPSPYLTAQELQQPGLGHAHHPGDDEIFAFDEDIPALPLSSQTAPHSTLSSANTSPLVLSSSGQSGASALYF